MSSKKILKSLGRTAKLCRKVLMTVTSFALMSAALIAVAGVLLRFGQTFIGPHITNLVIGISETTSGEGVDVIDVSQFDFGLILASTASALLFVAIGTGILSGTGLLGAKLNLTCVTAVYCILMGLWTLVEIFGAIVVFHKRDLIDNALSPPLLEDLRKGYQGFNGTDLVSQTWNLIMITFSCCGISNFTDFEACEKWQRQYYQEGRAFKLQTPLTCCVFTGKGVDDFSCAINPQDRTSNYLKGCYAEFWKVFDNYQMFAIIIIATILLFQLLLTGCSAFLAWSLHSAHKNSGTSASKTASGKYSNNHKSTRNLGMPVEDPYSILGQHGMDRQSDRGPNLFSMFPGFPNYPYTPSTTNLMQDCGNSYLGQLVAAAFLQQQIAGFAGNPTNFFNQDQGHRNSVATAILRHIGNHGIRRSSQELAVSLYSHPPTYNTAISPRIFPIDDRPADRDSPIAHLNGYSNSRNVSAENSEKDMGCGGCSNHANSGITSQSPDSRDSRRSVRLSEVSYDGQRTRSNTNNSCGSSNRANRCDSSVRIVKDSHDSCKRGTGSPTILPRQQLSCDRERDALSHVISTIANQYVYQNHRSRPSILTQVTDKGNIHEEKRQRTRNNPKELHHSRTEKLIPVRGISKSSTFSQSFGGFPSTETSHI